MAGRGGQGVLVLGRILGKAISRYTSYYVLGSESYAAEVRGGDSRADLIISDSYEEADFIKVRAADIALFMHQQQLEAYLNLVRDGGVILVDYSNIIDPGVLNRLDRFRVQAKPYTEIAERLFNTSRVANMIALGHIVKILKIIDPEHVEKIIADETPKEWREINIRAFRRSIIDLD
ncbi:MAG: 2-oxoacid:acceptor oxidoreductase family protein [Sulfolobales archaeon]